MSALGGDYCRALAGVAFTSNRLKLIAKLG
jgi:hypothetical protein